MPPNPGFGLLDISNFNVLAIIIAAYTRLTGSFGLNVPSLYLLMIPSLLKNSISSFAGKSSGTSLNFNLASVIIPGKKHEG